MPTLWQMFTEKKEEPIPTELQYFNPLKLKQDNFVKIHTIELEDHDFKVKVIRPVKREIGNQTFFFADYDLITRTLNDVIIEYRLRVIPLENPDGDVKYSVLLLKLLDRTEYNKKFHISLEGELEFQEGNVIYTRLNDIRDEWIAEATELQDQDHDGTITEDEITKYPITYWDYINDKEFYIIEMNGKITRSGTVGNGEFSFWQGKEIIPEKVEVQ